MQRALALAAILGLVLQSGCDQTRSSSQVDAEKNPGERQIPVVEPLAPANHGAVRSMDLVLARSQLPEGETRAEVEPSACPEGMVHVVGSYCPEVKQVCESYLDPPGRYEGFRCAKYLKSKCLSKTRVDMTFCIDRNEYTSAGESLPANDQSFTDAERKCHEQGKRVCLESEWNFACEGEEMRPYPYGFERDEAACNADRTDLVDSAGQLRDLRAPSGASPRCASPFGVLDLAGNLEEFVAIDDTTPVRPAMKGAYWQPSRNHCRAKQTAHDRYYHGTETGFRCCSDPAP